MDDLNTLLERTTPSVSAPNVGALTRRARVRHRRRWASVVIPLVVLAAGAVALRPATGHHVTTANSTQPIGTWRRTSPPPLDLNRRCGRSRCPMVASSSSPAASMATHPRIRSKRRCTTRSPITGPGLGRRPSRCTPEAQICSPPTTKWSWCYTETAVR